VYDALHTMNARALPGILLVFPLAALLFGGCSKSSAPAPATVADAAEVQPEDAADALVDSTDVATDSNPAAQASDATVMMVSAEKPLPASIKPSPALAEVIKLAESGLDENVMLAYVSNSPSAFGLGSEEIIFLTDIGVPGPVISAMIQKDHLLSQAPPPMMIPPAGPAMFPPTNVFTTYQAMTPPPAYAAPTQMEPPPAMTQEQAPPPEDPYAGYYDNLAPYGNWVNVDGYGVCWQPAVAVVNTAWRPYCDHGHWVYSNCGWYWYSDYSWGWCAFHYGRWLPHATLGWCWVPGSAWAPAWVTWRYSNNYCAWAPLPPAPKAPLAPNAALAGNAALAPTAPNAPRAATAPRASLAPLALTAASFNVVPVGAMQDHHLSRYALPRDQATRVLGTTTTAANLTLHDNVPFNGGIPAEQVAAVTRAPIHPVSVRSMVDNTPNASRVEHLTAGAGTPTPARQPPGVPQQPNGAPANAVASTPPSPQSLPWIGRSQPGRSATPQVAQNQFAASQNPQQELQVDPRVQQAARQQQQTLPWQPANQVNRKPPTTIVGSPTQPWRPADVNRGTVQPAYQRPDAAARGRRPEDDAQVSQAQSQPAQVSRYYAAPAQPPPSAVEVPRYAPASPAGQQFSRPVSGVEPRASYAQPAQSAPQAAAPAPAPAQSHSAQSAPASAPARSDTGRTGR
jgi:hypothetical protein